MYMVLKHINEEIAIRIYQGLLDRMSWDQMVKVGIAPSENHIRLVVKEKKSSHIGLDQKRKIVILEYGAIIRLDPNRLDSGKKDGKITTDKEHVKNIAGLDATRKDVKTGGTVETTDIISTQAAYLSNEMKLALWVGIYTLERLRKKVELTQEEIDKPELARNRYYHELEESHLLIQDTKALDREMAENIVARQIIKELQALLEMYKDGFHTCASLACNSCRKKIVEVLNMKAHLQGIEVEIGS